MMQYTAQFVFFLAVAYGLGIANRFIRNRRGLVGWFILAFRAMVLLTPVVIAGQHVMLRALACLLAIDLFFKIADYAGQRSTLADADKGFSSYARFLIPFPVLQVRFEERATRRQFEFSWWRITVIGIAGFVFCVLVLLRLADLPLLRASFLFDHTVKFVLFAVAIEFLSRMLQGIERMAGYDTKPLVDNAFLSQTVGEFWLRYNTRVHAWFEHNVFRPLNARRSPRRAVLVTFFVSAVLHELGFAIATSRWDGYQFAFFMVQAPAVLLWRAAQNVITSTAVSAIVLRTATIVWMWATSMLFFHGVNRVFPIFYSEPWLK